MVVNVVMPIYNQRRELLEKAISSVADALDHFIYKHPDVITKFIMYDDGSTEQETIDVINETAKKYEGRVIVCKSDVHRGEAVSMNTLHEYLTGDYIVIVHSDDIQDAHRISDQFETMEMNPDVFMQSVLPSNYVGWLYEKPDFEKKYAKNSVLMSTHHNIPNYVIQAALIYRLNKAKSYQLRYNPKYKVAYDYDFAMQALKIGLHIQLLGTPLFEYTQHEDNHSYKHREWAMKENKMIEDEWRSIQ